MQTILSLTKDLDCLQKGFYSTYLIGLKIKGVLAINQWALYRRILGCGNGNHSKLQRQIIELNIKDDDVSISIISPIYGTSFELIFLGVQRRHF